jgi:hypothetical protein
MQKKYNRPRRRRRRRKRAGKIEFRRGTTSST